MSSKTEPEHFQRADVQPPSRSDASIRPLLLEFLRSRHHRDDDAFAIQELGLRGGRVRVDVAVVNGTLHGYEIKADLDRLCRLERQATVYSQVLDLATLVVGERHMERATAAVPMWWEIILVRNSSPLGELVTVRRGKPNPGRSARALAELLWLDEALAMLEERAIAAGCRSKPRRVIWDRLVEACSLAEIAAEVLVRLKARPTLEPVPLRS